MLNFINTILAILRDNRGEWTQTITVTHAFGQTDRDTVFDGIADWILQKKQKALTDASDDDTIHPSAKPLCSLTKEEN